MKYLFLLLITLGVLAADKGENYNPKLVKNSDPAVEKIFSSYIKAFGENDFKLLESVATEKFIKEGDLKNSLKDLKDDYEKASVTNIIINADESTKVKKVCSFQVEKGQKIIHSNNQVWFTLIVDPKAKRWKIDSLFKGP